MVHRKLKAERLTDMPINLRLPADLRERVAALAPKVGGPQSNVLRLVVIEGLKVLERGYREASEYPPYTEAERRGICRIPGCDEPRRGATPELARKWGARVCEGHWLACKDVPSRGHDDFWNAFDRGDIARVEPKKTSKKGA